MIFNDLVEWLEFYQEWWERENVQYPAWKARMAAEVELLYSHDSGSEDDDPWEELDMDLGTCLEIP